MDNFEYTLFDEDWHRCLFPAFPLWIWSKQTQDLGPDFILSKGQSLNDLNNSHNFMRHTAQYTFTEWLGLVRIYKKGQYVTFSFIDSNKDLVCDDVNYYLEA